MKCPQCGERMIEYTDDQHRHWLKCGSCNAQIPIDAPRGPFSRHGTSQDQRGGQ